MECLINKIYIKILDCKFKMSDDWDGIKKPALKILDVQDLQIGKQIFKIKSEKIWTMSSIYWNRTVKKIFEQFKDDTEFFEKEIKESGWLEIEQGLNGWGEVEWETIRICYW